MEDFRTRVEAERPYLLRYAGRQLRDRHAAEDAVQETLLAALAGEAAFAGRSNLRTWLTGILKHKIIDAIRRASRDGPAPDPDTADLDSALYDERGHWVDPPSAWPDPDASLEQRQFFAVLERCLERLPAKTAQAFMMREHMGFETGEICKELGVSATHCWVLLYRARRAARMPASELVPEMIFPSCKEVSHLVSQGLDRRLGFGERVRLRVHLAICDGCTNFKRQLEFLRKAMLRLGSE